MRYAWWPAQLLPRNAPEGDYEMPHEKRPATDHLCRFFGTYDICWIGANRLQPFHDALPLMSKKCRTAAFRRSIEEAEAFYKDGTEPDQFQSTEFVQQPLVSSPSDRVVC